MKSKIAILVLVLLSVFALYKYIYKPHPNTIDQEVAFEGAVDDFSSYIMAHELENKYVIIEGEAQLQTPRSLSIKNASFHFADTLVGKGQGSSEYLYIQGRYLGFDELLEEYSFDKCIILNK